MDPSVEDHLPSYRVRPRFRVTSDKSIKEITSDFARSLDQENGPCIGKVREGYVALNVVPDDQHYWSPQLTLSMEDLDDGKTLIRGLYSPRPAVWTLFVFFYSVIGLAVLVIGTLGLSYYTLDKPTTVLWWIPVLTGVFLTLYLVAYFGQKVGHDQMLTIHQFFEDTAEVVTEK